ncbi:hypothetical protein C0058_11200 [Pseudomonas sp. NC02]|nr:hypothetical protein C0058_11200 [Pseudomonas sp. NC02]
MGYKKPSDFIDEIIRYWLNRIYNKDGKLFLSIDYSRISPPAGTAHFSGSNGSFSVVFECGGSISKDNNPFTFIRDGND